MRTLGIGIDLQHIGHVERAVSRYGDRFLNRIYTEGEVEYCRARRKMAQSLTARFAAKEAFRKSVGAPGGIRWRDIEVVRERGAPWIALHGNAKLVAEALGVERIHLSLSHSGDYAIAMIQLEGN